MEDKYLEIVNLKRHRHASMGAPRHFWLVVFSCKAKRVWTYGGDMLLAQGFGFKLLILMQGTPREQSDLPTLAVPPHLGAYNVCMGGLCYATRPTHVEVIMFIQKEAMYII